VAQDEFAGRVVVVDEVGGSRSTLDVEFFHGSGLARFQDDDRLMVGAVSNAEVYDAHSGDLLVQGRVPSGAHTSLEAVDATGGFVVIGNQAKSLWVYPVEDVPPGESASRTVGAAPTDTPNPISTALSPGGQRVATSVDGRIYVGEVVAGDFEIGATVPLPAATTLPGSGTTSARTLAFLGQDVLVSASGTAVSVWDLRQASRLGPLLHAPYTFQCNACGPGTVLVAPSGDRALVANEGASSVVLADFTAHQVEYSMFGDGTLGRFLGKHGAWLDDNRFLTWDDTSATASVWTGPTLARIADRWTVPEQRRDPFDQPETVILAGVTPDRARVVDSSGRVLDLDLAGRRAEALDVRLPLASVDAMGVDPSGERVWTLRYPQDEFPPTSTRVAVVEAATGEVLLDERLDGYYSHADLVDDTLRLANFDRPVTVLDVSSGEASTLPLQLRDGASWARTEPFVTSERNGIVSVYDTHLGAVVATIPVPTAAYSWTEIGYAPGDRALVLATSAADETGEASFRLVRLGYDQWRDVACATAGRNLTADEWTSLTQLAVPDDLGCAGP
jgi:hypothetical protein